MNFCLTQIPSEKSTNFMVRCKVCAFSISSPNQKTLMSGVRNHYNGHLKTKMAAKSPVEIDAILGLCVLGHC